MSPSTNTSFSALLCLRWLLLHPNVGLPHSPERMTLCSHLLSFLIFFLLTFNRKARLLFPSLLRKTHIVKLSDLGERLIQENGIFLLGQLALSSISVGQVSFLGAVKKEKGKTRCFRGHEEASDERVGLLPHL